MAWPSTTVSTANLDASSDSPVNARADLLQAVQYLNDIINSRSVASGLAPLDSSGLVPSSMLPSQLPSGMLSPYAGTTEPAGWLLCYGQAVNRTTYAALFTAIGTTWGSGDGSTTFNLPDMRGRVPAGKDNMGGSAASRLTSGGSGVNGATLGAVGGSETHTLTVTQIPAHGHPYRSRSDTVSSPTASPTGGFLMNNNASGLANRAAFSGTPSDTNGEQIGGTGGGGAHNNTQPTAVVNYIIKT